MSFADTVALPASQVKNNFGAALDMAQRAPVAIERWGRRVAFLVSPADIAIMEDYHLGKKAQKAMKNGATMSVQESEDYLDNILHA